MKADIHPNYHRIVVHCTCGNEFETRSTYKQEKLRVEVCNACHPFFTGKHKIVDTEGRVDQFMRRYGSYTGKGPGQEEAKTEE